jgi:putative ABC transport system permease protein
MLKNYLKIALRNLKKNPAYSFINVAGLAIGIACCVVMLLYVQDELTFDAFHQKSERIYRLVETKLSPDQDERHFPYAMGPVGPALAAEFPEVINTVRLRDRQGVGRFTVGHGVNRFYEGDYLIAEASFFEIFDFTLLHGDPETALAAPLSVVLTKTAAKKYFGNENPLGQTLTVERFGDFKVTGLLQNPPKNSHLDFSMLFSFATLEANKGWKQFIDSWDSDTFITYVLTRQEIDISAFGVKLSDFVRRHRSDKPENAVQLSLQPLRDIHFGSAHLEFDRNSRKSEIAYIYIFSIIALFVLLIACINYMNLATARAMKRAKEVGMRKVAGAQKSQLAGQFLGESILLSGLGLFFAMVLVEVVLPRFNAFADKNLSVDFSGNGWLVFSLFALILFVGIVSGSYPAFYLSRLNPVTVFKGAIKSGAGASRLRRGLVVTQFALSILMIVATVVATKQLNYIRTKNLGFNQEQLVVVDINSGNSRRNFESIKNEMKMIPAVKNVSVSSRVPGEWKNITQIQAVPEGDPETAMRSMHFICIDANFLATFEMRLVAGRNLSDEMGTDTSAVIINEAAARLLGWDSPLDKELRVPASNYRGRVVGVVRDFHFQSLHEKIGPLVLGHWKNPITVIDYFTARVNAQNLSATLAALQKVHERFDRVTPFEYNFLDERLNDFYQTDIRVGKIFGASATLAIFIACLGLLGLAAFIAEQRTKEIGVRKVLGASVGNIIFLLSKDFTKLVVIATVIASPIAYFALKRWLQNFAYHIAIGVDTFLLAGLIALMIALLTISFQAIRAALANPVEALRYE